MWLLFGSKTRVKPVEGGRTVERYCDECKAVRKLVECDVKDRLHVFLVNLGEMVTRRMVCRECGEDYDLPADARPAAAPVPAPAGQARGKAPAPPAKAPAPDLDKMLADLKKKMKSS